MKNACMVTILCGDNLSFHYGTLVSLQTGVHLVDIGGFFSVVMV